MRASRRSTCLASSLLILLASGCRDGAEVIGPEAEGLDARASASPGKVVQVATPTGDPATDIANIKAAIAAAGKNFTIQFAAGTYALGDNAVPLRVEPKGVSLMGHSAGTTIQGGTVINSRVPAGFHLRGKQQSIRGMTFRSFGASVVIGFSDPDEGGYSVTDCTFIESFIPVRVSHASGQITRISGNRFMNVFIPIDALGDRFEFSWNSIMVPDPSRIPLTGRPGNTGQFASAFVGILGRALNAEHNVIEHNTVDDYPDGYILASFPNSTVRGTIVRNNVHRNARQYGANDIGTIVVPESLGGVTENNLIIGNTLIGAEGFGMFVWNSPGNRIIGNTIRDVRLRPMANGSHQGDGGFGMWLLGSDGTHVLGNNFSGNETADVVLDGNDNLVVLRESDDTVLDNGENNSIVGVGGGQNAVVAGPSGLYAIVAPAAAALAETIARQLLLKTQPGAATSPDEPLSPEIVGWWDDQ